MGLDAYLSPKTIELRNVASKLMDECHKDILPCIENETFPTWIIPKVRDLGICGLTLKEFNGGKGLSTLE